MTRLYTFISFLFLFACFVNIVVGESLVRRGLVARLADAEGCRARGQQCRDGTAEGDKPCCSGLSCSSEGYCESQSHLGASKDCVQAIQPKSHPECVGRTVTVDEIKGAGQFCYCGCGEAQEKIAEYAECAGHDLASSLFQDIKKIDPGVFEKAEGAGNGVPFLDDLFQGIKKMAEGSNTDCAPLKSAAVEACEKCPVCKFLPN